MKYFIDTEFHEYKKKNKLLLGKSVNTIELISIGIVSESCEYPTKQMTYDHYDSEGKCKTPSREYYAICKEFDVYAAWNSFQMKTEMRDAGMRKVEVKEYWLRENVLKPIFTDLLCKERVFLRVLWNNRDKNKDIEVLLNKEFTYSHLKSLLKKHGKTKTQIAEEIHAFIYEEYLKGTGLSYPEAFDYSNPKYDPEFYAYYADYDWVVFCWLFGRMIDLPKGFPKYCKDLKQLLDHIQETKPNVQRIGWSEVKSRKLNIKDAFKIKLMDSYPKQDNEHNALADAKWNLKLFNFLIDK